MKPFFGGGWREAPGDGTRMRRLSRSDTCKFAKGHLELREEVSLRDIFYIAPSASHHPPPTEAPSSKKEG